MIKIFKQLGRHWAACIAVVVLLFVQAYCDLSLPDYTSKIVDIGIQQGGIESPVPETVRDTTLQALTLLMSEEDAALAEQWYSAPDADGVRTLSHDATAAMSELENAFATPDIVLYMAAAKNAATAAGTADAVTPTTYDLDAVATQFAAMSQAPGAREMLQSQLAAAFASLDDSVAGSLSSQAMLLVALEYEAQGIAHDVQMGYLLRTGGRMLMVTKRADWYRNKLKAVFGGVRVYEQDGYCVFCAEKRAPRRRPEKTGPALSKKLRRKYGKT